MKNPKLKVAIVVPSIHEGGGVPAVARYLSEILSDYDCQYISVSTSKNDRFSTRLLAPQSWFSNIKIGQSEWEGKPVIDVGAFFTELEFQRYMPRKALTTLLDQYDIVQIVAGAPAWAYVAKNTKTPVFLQVATLVSEERKNLIAHSTSLKKCYLQFTTSITSFIETLALQRVDRVFVENFWMKAHLDKLLSSNKVILAPPGVDANIFKPSTDPKYSGDKYIVSIGRFNDKRKNVRLLFAAYAELAKMHANPPMLILGGLTGPSDSDWEYARQLGIDSAVLFKSNLSETELVELLQNADLFVCSSDEEGLGIAMIEALACGTPVVSTKCGGPEVFLRHDCNGYLVENHNPQALANHIDMILNNEVLRDRMSKTARSDVLEKFSKEATGKLFLEQYAGY